ncbi:MAG: hypothetical protein EP347_10535 [Alphaproteobacteria bacterium]|nr:MAG: hypothetical protein EP347_10535 [Alphaproteobacteria bacterium]
MGTQHENLPPLGSEPDPNTGPESAALNGLGHLRLHIDCDKNEINISDLKELINLISSKQIPILSVYLENLSKLQREDAQKISEDIAASHSKKAEISGGGRIYVRLEPSEAEELIGHLVARSVSGAGEVSAAQLTGVLQAGQETPPDLILYIGKKRHLAAANLWSGAYAEFVFFEHDFADFQVKDLEAALAGFGKRERRFGGVS